MQDLSHYSESQLRETAKLLRGDAEFSYLANSCELELAKRNLTPIEEIFPDGGYMKEENGKEIFVPIKD